MASLKFRLPFICEISHFYEILFVKREGSLIFWKKIHPTNSHCDEKLGRDETLTWWHTTINRQCQYTTKFWQLMVMGESVANYSCLFFFVCVCVFFLVVGYCATTLFVVRQRSMVDVWLVTLHCRRVWRFANWFWKTQVMEQLGYIYRKSYQILWKYS
jgi:hypothetical protein